MIRSTGHFTAGPATAFISRQKSRSKTLPVITGQRSTSCAHWTGHPSRLDRPTLNASYQFGDTNYAKEELRAELASVFLAAERGIPHKPEQHAAYVGSWIKALRQDKNEIFRAAHDASAATDYLLALERDRSIAEESLAAGPAFGLDLAPAQQSWKNKRRSLSVIARTNGSGERLTGERASDSIAANACANRANAVRAEPGSGTVRWKTSRPARNSGARSTSPHAPAAQNGKSATT